MGYGGDVLSLGSDSTDPSRAAGASEAKAVAIGEHRTVRRVVSILEAVVASEPDGLRLGDLSKAIGAPKSSAYGLARGLVTAGYLREEDNRYFSGAAIAGLLGGRMQHQSVYSSALSDLRDRWNETVMLGMLVGEDVVYLDTAESMQVIRYSAPLNVRRPLWPTSIGKALLSYFQPARRDSYLKRHLKSSEEIQRATEELLEAREARVAVNRSETLSNVTGVGSPIVMRDGTVSHAIAVAGPAERMLPHLDGIIESVRDVATELSGQRTR